jgi:hypothetical protein
MDELIELMKNGDLRCSIAMGASVKKILNEPGDIHPVGAKGKVTGSLFHPEMGSAYLVLFDGTPVDTFIIEKKIQSI